MTSMPAIFSDKRGTEHIVIQTTGLSLSTTIRGIVFTGTDFDSLTPETASDLFDLCRGDLCGCVLRVSIPRGGSAWFEDELLSLATQLPKGFTLEACITCGLGDYSPYGHGCFGGMACFRDVADEYRLVQTKAGIFAIRDRLTKYVQETHYCQHYEPRPPGRGCRG